MTQSSDTPATFWWALRHYRWLAVALAAVVIVITDGLAIRQQTADEQYEATALVIANSLAHSPEQLPRLAEALLAKDSVAEDAIQAGTLPWSARTLRERHVELTPLEQNVLIQVTGRAGEPELAARTANAVADALAEALNRPGRGVGVFSVQHRATPPTEPAEGPSLPLLLAAGLLAAVLLPLGVVGLLLTIRRPLSRPAEAAAAAGAPTLGVVWLPSAHGAPRPWARTSWPRRTVEPSQVPGLQSLCRALFPDGKGGCLLSAPAGAAATRTRLAGWLVRALAERGEVIVVPAATSRWPEHIETSDGVAVHDRPVEEVPDHPPSVIDGFDLDGVPARQLMPDGAGGVLVVPEGSRRAATVDAAEQFADGELTGIVFVRR